MNDDFESLWKTAKPAALSPDALARVGVRVEAAGRQRRSMAGRPVVAVVLVSVLAGGVAVAAVATYVARPRVTAPEMPSPAQARSRTRSTALALVPPTEVSVPVFPPEAPMAKRPDDQEPQARPRSVALSPREGRGQGEGHTSAPRTTSASAARATDARPTSSRSAARATDIPTPPSAARASDAPTTSVAPSPRTLHQQSAAPLVALAAAPPSRLGDETRLVGAAVRALRNDRNPTAALAILDDYAARFPFGTLKAEASLTRIDALQLLGRKRDLLLLLDQTDLEQAPRARELRVLRGELRYGRGRAADAVSDFEAELALGHDDAFAARALYGRAVIRSKNGDRNGARTDMQDFVRRFPRDLRTEEIQRTLGGSVSGTAGETNSP